MIVYRVENDACIGPYHAGAIDTMDCKQCPHPFDDGMSRFDQWRGRVFGFASIDALLSWWGDAEIRELEALGFAITVFDVPDAHVVEGYKQLAFDRDQATIRGTLTPFTA